MRDQRPSLRGSHGAGPEPRPAALARLPPVEAGKESPSKTPDSRTPLELKRTGPLSPVSAVEPEAELEGLSPMRRRPIAEPMRIALTTTSRTRSFECEADGPG